MIDELKTMEKVVSINYMYQVAVVLNVSDNIKDVKVGDHVFYRKSVEILVKDENEDLFLMSEATVLAIKN
jgi:co-chaperonin GroES (HSP10)